MGVKHCMTAENLHSRLEIVCNKDFVVAKVKQRNKQTNNISANFESFSTGFSFCKWKDAKFNTHC